MLRSRFDRSSPPLINRPLKPRNLFTVPSAGPELVSAEAINSTSVLLKWQPVPLEFRNGIISHYTIHFRDVEKNKNDSVKVKVPALSATVNGLRQKATYEFWIVAGTSKGDGRRHKPTKTAVTDGKQNNTFIGIAHQITTTTSTTTTTTTIVIIIIIIIVIIITITKLSNLIGYQLP